MVTSRGSMVAPAICVVILAFVQTVFSRDEIHFVTMEILDVDDPIVEIEDFDSFTIDQGRVVTNATIELSQDLPEDAMLCVDGFEKLSNGYGSGYINLPCTKLCKLIKEDTCLYPGVQKASMGTLPEEGCPIVAGEKMVFKHVLDLPCLPDSIQRNSNDWKFNLKIVSNDKKTEFFKMSTQVKIVTPD